MLVADWLKGIGLGYAIPIFEAAGIVTPSALGELDPSHFEALGVRVPDDRRKLFYLVQRVKQQQAQQSERESTGGAKAAAAAEEEAESEVAMPQRNSRRSSTSSLVSHGGSNPPRGRLSGVPAPKKRSSSGGGGQSSGLPHQASTTAAPPKSLRTGKPLSAVPSHASAPMSPLVDLKPSHPLVAPEEAEGGVVDDGPRSTGRTLRSSGRSTSRAHSAGTAGEANGRPAGAAAPSRLSSLGSRLGRRTTRGQSLQWSGSSAAADPPPVGGPRPQPDASSTTTAAASSLSTSTAAASSLSTSASTFAAQIQRLWEENARAHVAPPPQSTSSVYTVGQRVSVVVRKRPVTNDVDVLQCLPPHKLLVYQPKTRVDLRREVVGVPFGFDAVLSESESNATLYGAVVRPLIPSLLGGQCATVFCFGQTGSGKTHTLFGSRRPDDGCGNGGDGVGVEGAEDGLYLLAARDVFSTIRAMPDFGVTVGLFELYDRKVLDLLADRAAVPCWEDASGKVQFPGLSWHDANDADDLRRLVEQGNALRSTGTTSKNSDSSRSHAVLQLQLDQLQGGGSSHHPHRKRKRHRYATLTFIDLAGSERGADTALFSSTTRAEGAEINTSLLALKEVLRAMSSDGAQHIPFRGSKLTQVLKESLVEPTSACVMIACVSPNLSHCEPTLNTLRYAQCLKDFEKSSKDQGRTQPAELPIALQPPPQPSQELQAERGANRTKDSSRDVAEPEAAVASEGAHSDTTRHDPQRHPTTRNASHHIKSNSVHSEISNDDSALLDEILSSPASVVNGSGSPPSDQPEQRRLRAAQQLFLSHKDAMTAMLSMVKEEMAIVCNHSGDSPEATARYMEDVKAIQDRQLDYIVKLREHLLQFYEAGDPALDQGQFHNESFEDLRD